MLNALDLVTTFLALENGAKEANPVAKLFINNKPVAILIKGGVTTGVLHLLRKVKTEDKKAAIITLGMLNLLYGYVVTKNFGVFFEVRR